MRVSKNEVVAPNSVPHPLDPAIQLAHQSIGMIQRDLNDYTGVLVKREKIGSLSVNMNSCSSKFEIEKWRTIKLLLHLVFI